MTAARILVVEDEETIAESIAYTLRSEGFDIETVGDGKTALERALNTNFELMLLDVMLPGLSGFEVCRRVRAESALPILMITARTAEVDRVTGLEAGADDYILKPFSMPELVGRVRAMLRRRELDRDELGTGLLRAGGLQLDLARRAATVDGRTIPLTTSEFRLLSVLAERPGHVVSRRELMQRLWDSTYVGDARAADVHVANLRRKIEPDPANPVRLLTVRGAGYALAEV